VIVQSSLLQGGVMGVADRTITPLIPPRLSGSSTDRMRAASGGRLPLAELPALPRSGSLRYGMGRVDSGGRVSNGLIVAVLGWGAGDRLHLALVGGSVVMHRDPTGAFRLGRKPYVVVPASVRHRSGLGAGAQVLLVADPNYDLLVVHPESALDSMISDYHAGLSTGGERR
jgi:hypothetical protein